MHFPDTGFFPNLHVFTNLYLILLGFNATHNWSNQWSFVIDLTSSPFLFPRAQGWGMGRLQPSKQAFGSPSNQCLAFSLVHFSHSVVSNSLQPHGPKHARPPCPSPTPGVYSNSCLSSQWCHPTISSSVVTFSSCLQSFPASGSFQMSQLFPSGGQSIGVSASTSVLPMNTQDWLDFLAVQGTLKSLLQHYSSKASIPWHPISL